MIYVMSDIHGEYEKFQAMLEKIAFSEEDALYILGDVLDRGPAPIPLLRDLAQRENVFLLLGNHEYMARDVLRPLSAEVRAENADTQLTSELLRKLAAWQMDGGEVTLKQFRALTPEMREGLLDYLEDLPAVEAVDMGEDTFLLVHAGLPTMSEGQSVYDLAPESVIFLRPDYDAAPFPGKRVRILCGHTPTKLLCGEDRIWHHGQYICMDCGAVFGGMLGCLCLNTMEEFYL